MKLSFLTGTIGDLEKAARLGFDGIELQATAFGNVAVQKPDKAAIDHARRLVEQHNVEITAMAYYGLAKGHFETEADISRAYERVFDIAEALGVQVIASMSGFDAGRDWQGNLQLFADRFGPIAEMAAQRGLLIALENWMSVSGHLPFKPINFGGSPDTWDSLFKAVPEKALGLEFDPSHLYWQGIDHIRALREFRDRVHHVHAKDTGDVTRAALPWRYQRRLLPFSHSWLW